MLCAALLTRKCDVQKSCWLYVSAVEMKGLLLDGSLSVIPFGIFIMSDMSSSLHQLG